MKLDPPAAAVTTAIKQYFAQPVKQGRDGREHALSNTSVRESEALILAQLATQFGRNRSLELGLALGASAVAIGAARQHAGYSAPHVVLDPFQADFGYVGIMELEKAGLRSAIEFREERSEEYLHDAARKRETFDFIFSDTGKGIGQALTDSFFIHQLLTPGGVVVYHDGLIYSHAVVWRFFSQEQSYIPLALPTDGVVKMLGRLVRHSPRLGLKHCWKSVPGMHRGLFALQKPKP